MERKNEKKDRREDDEDVTLRLLDLIPQNASTN